jgi:hypothetical protein
MAGELQTQGYGLLLPSAARGVIASREKASRQRAAYHCGRDTFYLKKWRLSSIVDINQLFFPSFASISSSRSPQIKWVSGLAQAFGSHIGHVNFVLLAAFVFRTAAAPSPQPRRSPPRPGARF